MENDEIVKVKLNEVIPAPYNPRYIDDDEYEKLLKSIETYGFKSVLVINKRNNHVVGGNQSLKALMELGYTEANAIYVDLDDHNEKALNIALNKISGEFDIPKLKDIFDELREINDFDLDLIGFDMPEIEQMDLLLTNEDVEDDETDDPMNHNAIGKSDVTCVVGLYRFMVDRDKFEEWENKIRIKVGLKEEDIIAEIMRRLGL